MPRILAASIVAGLLCAPANVLAQTPAVPSAELGGQVSMQTGQQRALTFTPRLTLPLSPLTSLDVTADIRPEHSNDFGSRTSSQSYGLHVRQVLWSGGRWQVFGVVGAGGERATHRLPGYVIDGRFGPEVREAREYTDTGLAVHVGPAVQVDWLFARIFGPRSVTMVACGPWSAASCRLDDGSRPISRARTSGPAMTA